MANGFSYTYTNPASGAVETKHSWMVEYDGLTFGSGWYERGPSKSDAPVYTKSFVQQAMSLYDAVGLEGTAAHYNTRESVDGQWYVFILDKDDIMLAHAANPDFVGRPASAIVGPNNYPAAEAVVAVADEDGAWLQLHLHEPCLRAPSRPSTPGWLNTMASPSAQAGMSAGPAKPTPPPTPGLS